ncbi:TPA: hypothetical protein ACGSGJ_004447 [Escherichia coli]|uniref:hypothetical protein n=1 Tax=Escherichia coli TaxID=562 RepID=UPI000DDFB7CA|nr:hypothetical protein [Escherichia coli]HDX6529713.1 hypothetical protein [Escherichia coli]
MRQIKITPYGGIGNQIFQYFLALAIKFRSNVPVHISGLDMPAFGIKNSKAIDQAFCIDIKSHIIPLEAVIKLIKDVQHIDINLKCLSTRMSYYSKHLPEFRRYLKAKNTVQNGYDENHLVINVRGAEISTGVHKNYLPVPISFYDEIIKKTNLRPVFVGQLGNDKYSEHLKTKFPEALFPTFNTWEDDFNVIRTSVNIIPAVSTFSWLASWLSETAKNIYFPIMGLYHPLARPDVDMLPIDDDRYHFYLSDLLTWGNPEETINSLINKQVDFDILEGNDLIEKLPSTVTTEGENIVGFRLAK